MKKVFLTSMIAMCTVAPAMATPSHSSNDFPVGGLMQEDYTYVNQAVYANTGVYTGNVSADANYENILYDVQAGQYLAQGTTTGTQCPANSYCPGLDDVLYDSENDQGIYACSSLTGGYTLSDAGSDANTDCYRNCTAADTGVTHAASATGTTNYGGTPSTDCTLATCDTGYTANNGACEANTYNITYDLNGGGGNGSAPTTYTYGVGATIDTVPTWIGGAVYGYRTFAGWCTDDQLTNCAMTQTIGTDATGPKAFYAKWTQCEPCSGNGVSCQITGVENNQCVYTTSCYNGYYGLTNPGAYNASCSQCPSGYSYSDSGATTNAQCYRECDAANMGTTITTIANASAFSGSDYYGGTSNDTCTLTGCVDGYHVDNGACAGNAITITWNGASQADIDANNAGSTVYGGNINTPRAATPIPGKRFTGWTFVKTQSAPACDLSAMGTGELTSIRWKPIGEYGITMQQGLERGYISSGSGDDSGLSAGEFERIYSSGTVKGLAVCSSNVSVYDDTIDDWVNKTTPYEDNATINQSGESFGCWCRVTEFNDGTNTCPVTTSPWVYNSEYYDYDDQCLDTCALNCAGSYLDLFGNQN